MEHLVEEIHEQIEEIVEYLKTKSFKCKRVQYALRDGGSSYPYCKKINGILKQTCIDLEDIYDSYEDDDVPVSPKSDFGDRS